MVTRWKFTSALRRIQRYHSFIMLRGANPNLMVHYFFIVLRITANSATPIIYDPRSGLNVTDFVSADAERANPTAHSASSTKFKSFWFIPESNEVVGVTSRRTLTLWRYNPSAAITVLPGHLDVAECLTLSKFKYLLFKYSC